MTSQTEICNLALQKLGVSRINDLDDDSPQARMMRVAYEPMRDLELSQQNWRFAVKRVTLAPHTTEPDFAYSYAFVLPTDFLKVVFPAENDLDYSIENHEGSLALLTNQTTALELVYIARITDTTRFHPTFVEALAARLALQCCEDGAGSSAKWERLAQDYRAAIVSARRLNGFLQLPKAPPEAPWLQVRR